MNIAIMLEPARAIANDPASQGLPTQMPPAPQTPNRDFSLLPTSLHCHPPVHKAPTEDIMHLGGSSFATFRAVHKTERERLQFIPGSGCTVKLDERPGYTQYR